MKLKKFKFSLLSWVLVASVAMTSVSGVLANEIIDDAKQGKSGVLENNANGEKIHDSIDISTIRNEGGNPPELLSKASSLVSADKQWYEYIRYSAEPVGICDVNSNSRIVFHDPYDYGNSLVMEVDDTITDWSSSNSLTATYETGNTIVDETSKSASTVTGVEVAKGADVASNVSTTTIEGQIKTYNESKTSGTITEDTNQENDVSETKYGKWSTTQSSGSDYTVEAGIGIDIVDLGGSYTHYGKKDTVNEGGTDVTITEHGKISSNITYSDDYKITDEGYTEDNRSQTTKTNVTTVIADRMSQSLGQNISETQSWSTNDSHSVSKTYEASYFNSSGSPLQWKIVKYKVIMPLMYKVQYLVDGEWITSDSGYCTLTTVQGTCRAWLDNNTAYYEHWGTGEPVTWNEFWGTFFTKEKLVEAYQTKLYPDQVRSVSAE